METAAAIRASRYTCAHCGLTVTANLITPSDSTEVFCCHACRLAAIIIGKQEQGEHSWNLLRLGIGALLAMNVMMVSLLLYTGSVEPHTAPLFRVILLALSAPAMAILIPPFLAGAWGEVKSGRMSLDTLIAGGSLFAFGVSAVHAADGTGEVYFDTATMLPVLVTVGKLLEASAKTRAADLLHGLESLLPATTLRVNSGGLEEIAIEMLRPGDLVRVRPGERIAVDGTILEGTGSVEEASFTGEFLPRLCGPGDSVVAGTVNGTGSLLVKAESTGEELLLHGIIEMIQDAWANPSRAELIAQRAAALFIPAVLVIAGGSLVCWSMTGNLVQGLLCALSVLVVACPCTMGIATPLATSLAVTRAARAGIVVRGGRVMEQLGVTRLIFFDKTGTITTGKPVVEEIILFDAGVNEEELLARVSALEAASEHALGRAVMAKTTELGIEPGQASDVSVFPGCGLVGAVTWRGVPKEVTVGSALFVSGDTDSPAIDGSCTAIDVAWDGNLRGRLLIGDTLRDDAQGCITRLTGLGARCVLLSGDRFPAAVAVATQVGIEEVYAPRTPAEKLQAVSTAVASGRLVAMVGDGINDAPALAAAQIGISLGGGMDLAKQAGNVILLSGRLGQIPWLITLGKKTGTIIRSNFAWSFAYNSVALAAAAAGLLHPLLASLSMVVSSLTVLGNSLRVTGFPDEAAEGSSAVITNHRAR